MTTFTFDGWFYFRREPYQDRWSAFTHPLYGGSDGFRYGYFRVSDGEYAGDAQNLKPFDTKQIAKIKTILRVHANDMDLEQFNVHLKLPDHHRRVDPEDERFANLEGRISQLGPYHPALAIAMDRLEAEDPAYRLTRDHVQSAMARATKVSAHEQSEWLREVIADELNDAGPRAREMSFEQFFESEVRALRRPTPLSERHWRATEIYEIEDLPDVYWVEGVDRQHERFGAYFAEYEGVLVEVATPSLSASRRTFIL